MYPHHFLFESGSFSNNNVNKVQLDCLNPEKYDIQVKRFFLQSCGVYNLPTQKSDIFLKESFPALFFIFNNFSLFFVFFVLFPFCYYEYEDYIRKRGLLYFFIKKIKNIEKI